MGGWGRECRSDMVQDGVREYPGDDGATVGIFGGKNGWESVGAGYKFEVKQKSWSELGAPPPHHHPDPPHPHLMFDASSAVTYTSVYTDSKPWRYYGEESAEAGSL
nr:hypothetical protein [Tanacetum cinerariifolium]